METSLQRAWQLYRFRRYPLALEETVKFLAQHPESPEAYCLAALIHGKEKRQRQAIEAAEAAIRYMPDWSYPHYVHALVNYWFDEHEAALRSLSEALRIQPGDADFYELVSSIHAEQGHLNTSLQMAEKGLEYYPEHVGCLFRRGVSLFELKRRAEAEVVFRTILTIENEHAPSQGFVGYFEVQRSNYADALPLLRNALRDNPEWKLAQSAWKESLRGHYPVYGAIGRVKHWLFEAYLWPCSASLFLVVCIVFHGIVDKLKHDPVGQMVMLGLVGGFITVAILFSVFVLIIIFMYVVSIIILMINYDLRRANDRNEKSIIIKLDLSEYVQEIFVVILISITILLVTTFFILSK